MNRFSFGQRVPFFLLFVFLILSSQAFASTWKKAVVPSYAEHFYEPEHLTFITKEAGNWSVRVAKRHTNMPTFSFDILWDPGAFGNAMTFGAKETLFSASARAPQTLAIHETYNLIVPNRTVPLNIEDRKIMFEGTVVSERERICGFDGAVEYEDGTTIPFTVIWDLRGHDVSFLYGVNTYMTTGN